MTGQPPAPVLAFAAALEAAGVPMVARHVVVPGRTDGEEHLHRLGRMLGGYRNLKGLEVLPYHTMGVNKYKALGLAYPLEGVPALEKAAAANARQILLDEIRAVRAGRPKP